MAVAPSTAAPPAVVPRHGALSLVKRFMWREPLGMAALVFIVVLLVAGIFAETVTPYDPVAMDFAAMFAPPSLEHPFGTDNYGRDILTRVVYGARTALVIGLASSFLGSTLGALLGVASAYLGGWVDLAVQRVVDILLSLPVVVLALVVVAMLGRTTQEGIDLNLIVAIAIPIIPNVARVVRSSALSIREMAYIDAARVAGFSRTRIMLRHMVPNLVGPYLIMLTAFIAQAILLEATLSFLGLGVNEPTPAWGLMLAGNAVDFYRQAPWMIVFPGLAISASVLAFNLFGDALRDWLDPKSRPV
ncbi:MAG: ABC transporter permease [Parafilimonas terrae]|nr:ABC transporter permease [Parafilimonas terrae]